MYTTILLYGIIAQAFSTVPLPSGSDGNGLVINEIMVEPLASSSTESGQWIELYNSSSAWINLSEWEIRNQDDDLIDFPSILIPPQGYFLVGASSVSSENGGYTPDAVWMNFSLSAQGGLSLENRFSDSQEQFYWDSSWDLYPGTSLERVNPGWSAGDRESWKHSTESFGDGDMGTPGMQNSVYSDSFGQNTWAFIKAFVN